MYDKELEIEDSQELLDKEAQ